MSGVDLTTGALLLGSGGFLALFGTLLTMRSGRQRDYDQRFDARATALETRNQELESTNDRLMEEQARLRFLLRSHGINPDDPARMP